MRHLDNGVAAQLPNMGEVTFTKDHKPVFRPAPSFLSLYALKVRNPLPVGAIKASLVSKPSSMGSRGPTRRDAMKATAAAVAKAFGTVASSGVTAALPLGPDCELLCSSGKVDASFPRRLYRRSSKNVRSVAASESASDAGAGDGAASSAILQHSLPPSRSGSHTRPAGASPPLPPRSASKSRSSRSGAASGSGSVVPRGTRGSRSDGSSVFYAKSTRASSSPSHPPRRSALGSQAPSLTQLLGAAASVVHRRLVLLHNALLAFEAMDRTGSGHVGVADVCAAGAACGTVVATVAARNIIAACAPLGDDGVPLSYAPIGAFARLVLNPNDCSPLQSSDAQAFLDAVVRGWVEEASPTPDTNMVLPQAAMAKLVAQAVPYLSSAAVRHVVDAVSVPGPFLGARPVADFRRLTTVLATPGGAGVSPHPGHPHGGSHTNAGVPSYAQGVGPREQRRAVLDVMDVFYDARVTLRDAFNKLVDKKGRGVVNVDDVAAALEQLHAPVSRSHVRAFFAAADANHVGELSLHDWLAAFGPDSGWDAVAMDAVRDYFLSRAMAPADAFHFMVHAAGSSSRGKLLLSEAAFAAGVRAMEPDLLLSSAQVRHLFRLVDRGGAGFADIEAFTEAVFHGDDTNNPAWEATSFQAVSAALYDQHLSIGEFIEQLLATAPSAYHGHVPVLHLTEQLRRVHPTLTEHFARTLAERVAAANLVQLDVLRRKLAGELPTGWQDDAIAAVRSACGPGTLATLRAVFR